MSKKTKVIFTEEVKGFGKKGEIKDIITSLVYNSLLPRQKVIIYDKQADNHLRQQQSNERQKLAEILAKEEQIFRKLNKLTLNFSLKEREGKIFGSVRITDIIKELEKREIFLGKKNFPKFVPLHEQGNHSVEVKVNKTLIAELIIIITGS